MLIPPGREFAIYVTTSDWLKCLRWGAYSVVQSQYRCWLNYRLVIIQHCLLRLGAALPVIYSSAATMRQSCLWLPCTSHSPNYAWRLGYVYMAPYSSLLWTALDAQRTAIQMQEKDFVSFSNENSGEGEWFVIFRLFKFILIFVN